MRIQLAPPVVLRKIPPLTLAEMRERADLADMLVLRKGNRLSITPVEPRHWKAILKTVGN